MSKEKKQMLHNYLSNLTIDVLLARDGICKYSCEGDNIRPSTNRFYFVCDGECKFTINNKTLYAKRGNLILVPKNSIFSFESMYSEGFERFVCHFVADFGNCNLLDFFKLPYIVTIEDERDISFLETLFSDLVKCNNSCDIPSGFRVQADLMKLISLFVDNSVSGIEDIEINEEKSLANVVVYIEENYKNSITIAELADYVHLHPNYFIKTFKKQFGIPPIQYINKLRLTKAKYALTNTSNNINQIAMDCGFNGQSQFSKTFKQMYSISPTTYREKYAKDVNY